MEDNNVLIHLGYHKTGTTWLQNHVFISKNDAFEPLSNKKRGVSSIAKDFIYDRKGNILNSFDNNEEEIKKNVNKILVKKESNKKMFVLSHERLSGNPHGSGFDAFSIGTRMKNAFPKARIFMVIREQRSFVFSSFFQYLSTGGNHGLNRYLNTISDGKRPFFSLNHFCYHHIIKFYQEAFGKENVLVLPYELFKSDKDSFFKIFSDFVGREVSFPPHAGEEYKNKKNGHYVMYKFRVLSLLRRSTSLNNYSRLRTKKRARMVVKLTSFLDKLVPQKFNDKIQQKVRTDINDWAKGKFKESNRITKELTGLDLDKYGYQH